MMRYRNKKILLFILLATFIFTTIPVYAIVGDVNSQSSSGILLFGSITDDENKETGVGKIIDSFTDNFTNPLVTMNPALGVIGTLKDTLLGFSSDKLRNYLADNAMNGLCGWVMDTYGNAVISVNDSFFNKFAPDVTQFLEYVGGDEYFDIFNTIGYTIAFGIFIYMMIMIGFGAIKLADVKDTPLQLVGGLIISLILIVNSRQIASILFDITNSIWNDLLAKTGTNFSISDCISCIMIPTMLTNVIFNGDSLLMSIFTPILGIIFLIQFIKFMLEIAERYIVACVLYYAFGMASSTIVSKNTRSIFKKYMQMLLCQLLMLIFNLIFIVLTCRMFSKGVVLTEGFTGWIFIFAFLKVAQRIDNYISSMGMSVAVTGGSVLESIVGASKSLTGMARGISGAADGVGGVLKSGGSLAGLKAGMTLSNMAHPIHNAGSLASGNDRILQEASKQGSLANISKQFTPDMVDSSLVNMARSGSGSYLNNLGMDVKGEIAKQAFGSGFMPDGSSLESLTFNKDGGMTGNLSMIGADGSNLTSSFDISPVSSDAAIRTLTTDDGTEMYLTSKGNLEEGETIPYQFDPENPDAISMAECVTGTDFTKLGDERENIDHITGDENGSSIIANSNNQILARTDGKNGVAFNTGLSLNASDLKHLPEFNDMDNISLENAGSGKVYVRGTCGQVDQQTGYAPCREYILTNRALYPGRESLVSDNAKYVGRFGTNNKQSGSWNIGLKQTTDSIKNGEHANKLKEQLYMTTTRNGSKHLDI